MNAACTNTASGPSCACNPGFTGNGLQCTDLNECLTSNGGCGMNATCTNTPGSRTCACNTGYSGNGFNCTDINECSGTSPCNVNATCLNFSGSFLCLCNLGWTGDGITCTDVNECATDAGGCHPFAGVCTNLPGSRACSCAPGYSGDGGVCADPSVSWVRQTLTGFRPSAGGGHGLATMAGGDVYLHSGSQTSLGAGQSDTFSWNGSVWTDRTTSTVVARRNFGFAPAQNSALLLFGGFDTAVNGTTRADTLLLSTSGWALQAPASAPSARTWPAMAYDPLRQRTVLFGGLASPTTPLQDTWEWNGTTWFLRTPTTTPGARFGAVMSWDPVRSRIVLFGGDSFAAVSNEVWEWDGTNWAPRSVGALKPPPRRLAGLAWNPTRQTFILHGGVDVAGTPLTDTWELNGATWRYMREGPPLGATPLAWDPGLQRAIVMGPVPPPAGEVQMWKYGP